MGRRFSLSAIATHVRDVLQLEFEYMHMRWFNSEGRS